VVLDLLLWAGVFALHIAKFYQSSAWLKFEAPALNCNNPAEYDNGNASCQVGVLLEVHFSTLPIVDLYFVSEIETRSRNFKNDEKSFNGNALF